MSAAQRKQQNARDAKRLFTHTQSKCVRFCQRYRCVRVRSAPHLDDWRSVSGLIDQLQRVFYWDYNYYRAARRGRKRPVESSKAMLAEKKRLATDGLELGKRIDDEANTFVSRKVVLGEDDRTAAQDMTLYTKKLVAAKSLWGWTPLVAQFPIAIPLLSVGTCIDSLEVDSECRLIAVEHKYGYQQYLGCSNANMDTPLRDINNCPLHQHFLQIGLAVLILEAIYGIHVHKAYVVYVDDYKVQPYELPMWFHERRTQIWETFVKALSKRAST